MALESRSLKFEVGMGNCLAPISYLLINFCAIYNLVV
jgi:hypothetical protein